MAGCSKEVVRDSHNPNEEPWVSDLSLPVPIEFGSSGFQFETKASMIKTSNLDSVPLRLFAIDTAKGLSATATADRHVLFANELARYDSQLEKIVFDGGKTWYYPYASSHNYSFYAYHVGMDNPVVTKGNSRDGLYVKVNLNECQSDILWAEAKATPYGDGEDAVHGFNAKYMRAISPDPEMDKYLPHLHFYHLTTAMTFNFKVLPKDADNSQANELLKNVKIESLQLSNIPALLNLWLVDNTEGEDNLKGKLMTQSGQENSFPVRMNCDTIKMANVGEVSKLGTLFVMVPDKVTTIEVDMVISVPLSSDSDVQTVPVKLKLTSADNFERGKEYSYTIEMRSLEEISFKVSVEEWNNGDEGSDEDQEIIVDGIESEEGGLIIE